MEPGATTSAKDKDSATSYKLKQEDLPVKTTSTNNQILIYTGLLAFWVAMVDLWLKRHYGSGTSINDISKLVGIPLGGLLSVGVVDFLLGKDKRESIGQTIKAYFRQIINTHLNGRVLTLLYLGSVVLAATHSTISIGPVKGGKDTEIVLTPIGASSSAVKDKLDSTKVTDFHLWINPFATLYELSVSGYLPAVVSIRPFFGTTVIPERDLIQSPTVLFRPPSIGFEILGSDGRFELYLKTNSGFSNIANDKGKHAWYFGPRRNQPGGLRYEWQIEAKALGLSERQTAIQMQYWRNPKKLDIGAIGPNNVVCALISNHDHNIYIAGVVGNVTKEQYIDLPLGEIQYDTVNPENNGSNNTGNSVCTHLDEGTG